MSCRVNVPANMKVTIKTFKNAGWQQKAVIRVLNEKDELLEEIVHESSGNHQDRHVGIAKKVIDNTFHGMRFEVEQYFKKLGEDRWHASIQRAMKSHSLSSDEIRRIENEETVLDRPRNAHATVRGDDHRTVTVPDDVESTVTIGGDDYDKYGSRRNYYDEILTIFQCQPVALPHSK